jgi:hypothetical protein
MRILGLTVAGAGKFDRPVTVSGFGDGVNLLCEQNEAGKSTLFRALRTCLFERHSSANEAVRSLACDGLSLPVSVQLQFEHGGESYEIEKSFLKQKRASLRRAGREIATNQEADEALWRLLGVQPGSGRSVDQAQFGLLWVSQGQSFEQPRFSEAATGALGAAIHAEVGALVGGERARMLLQEIRRDLGEFVTESAGKPRSGGPWAQALNNVADRTEEISEAERKLAAVEAQLTRLAQAKRERAETADPESAAALAADLAAAETELAVATEARQRLALREPLLKAKQTECDEARRRQREIAERASRVDADRILASAATADLAGLAGEQEEARRRLAEARAEAEAIATAELADEAALARLKDLQAALTEATLAPDLAARRTAIAEASRRLDEIDRALAANPASEALLDQAEALERDIAALAARIEAGAVKLRIEVSPEGAGRVAVNGETASGMLTLMPAAPVSIDAGGLAFITVMPPLGGEAERERRRATEAQRAALLSGAGLADMAALRLAAQARRALAQDRSGAIGALKGLGVEPAAARHELEALGERIEGLDRRLAAAAAAARLEHPDAVAIASAIGAIDSRRAARREALARIEGRREAANAALQRLSAEQARRQAALDEAERRLSTDLSLLPDAGRAAAAAAAESAAHTAEAALAEEATVLDALRRAAPDAERLRQQEHRVKRLREATERRAIALAELDRMIAHLEGQIESAGAEGLGERLAMLSEDAALWRRQAEKHERRVRTLQALQEAVTGCYDEQRERLHAPVKRYLKPYLEDVFASADPELGDGYDVQELARGAARERFEILSDGTKEQIAVLTRLAMGSLLAERGQAVPIILDDALVYSDDERIERMFDALGRAGAQQQVVVFTCRAKAFQRLGGRRLTLRREEG